LKDLRKILSYLIEKEQFLPMILLGYSTGADIVSAFINCSLGEDLLYLIKGVILIAPINPYISYQAEEGAEERNQRKKEQRRHQRQKLTTRVVSREKCHYFASGWKGYFQSFALSLAYYFHYIDLLLLLKDILQPRYYKRVMQWLYSCLLKGVQLSYCNIKDKDKVKEKEKLFQPEHSVSEDTNDDKEFWISFNHSQFLYSLIQWKSFLTFRKRKRSTTIVTNQRNNEMHSPFFSSSSIQAAELSSDITVDKSEKNDISDSLDIVCLYNENNQFYDVMNKLKGSSVDNNVNERIDLGNPFPLLSDKRIHDRITEFSLFLRYN
jgi:hypothetical protein